MEIWPVKVTVDLTPLVRSIATMADSTHFGVKKLLSAFGGEWLAKSMRAAMLQTAQNTADAKAIAAGTKCYDNGVVMDVISETTTNNLVASVAIQNQLDDAKRLLIAISETAAKIAQRPESDFNNEPISATFFTRWRKEVESVDDADVRQMWTSILSEEMSRPGSVSLRTLDVLKNLTRHDADLFSQLIKGAIGDFVPADRDGHAQYLSYDRISEMNEAGLLTMEVSIRTFSTKYTSKDGDGVVVDLDRSDHVLCCKGEKFQIKGYMLTRSGKPLVRLAGGDRSVEDVIGIAKFIATCDSGKELSVHEVIERHNKGLTWKTNPIWENTDGNPDDAKKMPKSEVER